jgi:hypothetical protein
MEAQTLLIGAAIVTAAVAYFLRSKEGFQDRPSLKVDLVVARYKENLDWLAYYERYNFHKIFVYNKSSLPARCPLRGKDIRMESLKNVGVCDHTYLYHIIHNYDSLADITVFAPASANLSYKRAQLNKTLDKVYRTQTSVFFAQFMPNGIVEEKGMFYLNRHIPAHTANHDSNTTYDLAPASIRPFGAWFKHWFKDINVPYVSYRGIFAVEKRHILSRPKSFYEDLIQEVNKDKFPEAAHYIERSWPAIFHPLPITCFENLERLMTEESNSVDLSNL